MEEGEVAPKAHAVVFALPVDQAPEVMEVSGEGFGLAAAPAGAHSAAA